MLTLLFSLAVQAVVADDKAAEDALDTFKKDYKAQAEADRAKAVTELAKVVHAKTLSRLAGVLASSDGPTVRCAAANGLGTFAPLKKQSAQALSGALASALRAPDVESSILTALGALDEPSGLAAVHLSMDEKKPEGVVKAAVNAAAVLGQPASVDPLIAFLAKLEKKLKGQSGGAVTKDLPGTNSVNTQTPEETLKTLEAKIAATRQALQDLTRQQLKTSDEWQAWWARTRATFKPAK